MHRIRMALMTALVLLTGCSDEETSRSNESSQPAHLIMSEGGTTSDGLFVSNGNVVVRKGQPGIAFAAMAQNGQPRRLVYWLIFNHDLPDAGVETRSGSTGSTANTFHTITTFGQECTVRYECVLGEDTQTVASESLSLADRSYEPQDGQLFLIDMKASPPTVTQLDLELPSEIPALKDAEATENFAEETLNRLRKADQRVDDFCKQCENEGA